MKLAYIFFLSFLMVSTAFAAKLVPGSVPNLPPLQAPPENTYPNYQNNITDSPEFHNSAGQQNYNGKAANSSQNLNGQPGQTDNASDQAPAGLRPGVLGLGYKKWFWIFLVFGVVLGYAYFKTRKEK